MNQHQETAPDEVAQVIANYTPRGIDLYHWLSIRDFVQQAVAESEPPTADEARRRMTLVSALAEWVGYGACFPVERRTVFDLDLMGEFIDTGNDWTPKVRRMAQGRLKTLAQRLNPDWPADLPEESAYSSAWDPQPYSAAETVALRAWADSQDTAERRASAQVLLALLLGAGLHSHEVLALRVRDIEVDDAGVLLRVRGQRARAVPVRSDYEQMLIELLTDAPGEQYVFAPEQSSRRSGLVPAFVAQSNPQPGLRPTARRLRATWVVAHITAGVPAPILVRAAGLTNLRPYERWLYTLPEYEQDAYRQALRKHTKDAP
ncbi:MAG: tyrosine-type recombinase/integrase [Humibacillus sp.]|nr:tyrosine-type recombinase/integrase [Humibacillus sp.]MDN5778856.1 tyrosine-type recombinase/integrase [Humibacillus sp.]